ncbi:hypothetical protein Ahy_A05g022613 isoform A [Arachis hypogaea]|uniref:Uncharacterized protein n=1 Tax=Arachis hypogaea TaxID=3818 RepID=A0A445D1E0_ARAHY|nr:hypothetical protein Ahy_A05g022613 isoform A [Arachis hypogaea]
MNVLEFSEYVNVDSEFVVSMKFSFRETVFAAIKNYTIFRDVDSQYNGSHTYTKTTISQDHAKLNSNMISEVIKPLVEADPSLNVKSVITKVQSKFNYTISYRKVWLVNKRQFNATKRVINSSRDETTLAKRGDEVVQDISILVAEYLRDAN